MSNDLLEWALKYAARSWPVFPLHGIVNGRCSCSKDPAIVCEAKPPSPGKHPRVKGGFKAATTDEAQIRRWWGRWPAANIGIATGSGLAVIDIDGQEGFHEFQALLKANQPLPETLVAQTGGGFHLVFSTRAGGPEVRNSARNHVHVRGEGGYVVAAPSLHHSGRYYKWIKQQAIAELPDWLRQWTQGYEISGKRPTTIARSATKPSYLNLYNQKDISGNLENNLVDREWSVDSQHRLESALEAIDVKACGYEDFLNIGFALHSLGWDRPDGTSIGFDIWNHWCAKSPHHNLEGLEFKWRSFGRSGRSGVTAGTIYHLARQHGWNPAVLAMKPAAPVNGTVNGTNGHHYALPPELSAKPILWPDVTEEGHPKVTMKNAMAAITHMGLDCRFDQFHNREIVHGAVIQSFGLSNLVDDTVILIRDAIRDSYGLDFKKENTFDALETLCKRTQFDPVCDYLAGLKWDGVPRLGTWLADYLNAAEDEFTNEVGRLTLIAAVRRARHPGTRFDQMLVLEGKEGTGKSTAIQILAGLDNFSDQRILDQDEKTQQEMVEGVWLYEIGELGGMRRAEVEHVKSFLSRHEDRARPAYARRSEWRRRRCVFIGTTNQDDYLISDSGNRRFWPVRVGRVDLEALRRDRDQLWAEAAFEEARGVSIGLPEPLWKKAEANQEARKQSDAWTSTINNYIAMKGLDQFILSDLMTSSLQLSIAQIGYREYARAASIVRQLGFKKTQRRVNGKATHIYVKSDD